MKNVVESLENQEKTYDTVYRLSLLYRYSDQYTKEKELLDTAKKLGHRSRYVNERLQWHELPMSEKCVPRKKFNAERLVIPKPESIEQMCFVLGGDTHYFQMIYESILSIKATRHYRDVPICLMDGGFTDAERHRLAPLVKHFADMDKFDGFLNDLAPLDSTLGRCFADRLFPGYRYYFFLDGDTWIHDENAVDRILCMTERGGISVIQCENWLFKNSYLYEDKRLTVEDSERIRNNLYVNSGVFCIDAQRELFPNMQLHIIRTIKTHGYKWNLDEAALCFLVHTSCTEKNIFINMTPRNHYLLFFGYPVVYDNEHFLYTYYHGNEYPLGIMHTKGTYNHEQYFYFPTQRVTSPLHDPEQIESQRQLSEFVYFNFGDEKTYDRKTCPFDILREHNKTFPNQTKFSVRYLVWPWENKTQLKNELDILDGTN